MVVRMILDSLRYWVTQMGVDGFRFDLCATLGRRAEGFDPNAPVLQAIRQDPVLSRVKLIAEPWDIGPGGYQLGAFPSPFGEWNDRYRDDVRRYWRGDAGMVPALAARITGSATEFDHSGRTACSSVNLLTAHDGYTLADLVAYKRKHNHANGEGNRDGHGENYSDNLGVEGPTIDSGILAARERRRRNLLATLFLSQGTPMMLAGDELGNSQGGNNNAYAQDNATGWVDWRAPDPAFLDFVRALIAFRRAHPILRQTRFLHAIPRDEDGLQDLFWWRPEGGPMTPADWETPDARMLVAEIRTAAGTPEYAAREEALLLVFNVGEEAELAMPGAPDGHGWVLWLDAGSGRIGRGEPAGERCAVPGETVQVFVLEAIA
jgi:glycogen operon protein